MNKEIKFRVWSKTSEKFFTKDEWFFDFDGGLYFLDIVENETVYYASSSSEKNDTLHIIKVTLQAHGWKTTNLPKTKNFLITNTRLFLEHTEQHKDRIFSAQLKDDAGNNNHWISVTCSKIHNAQWDEPLQLSEEN